MIGSLKRGIGYVLAGAGLLIAAVLAIGIGANTAAALWDERWQFVVVALGLGLLLLVGQIRRK